MTENNAKGERALELPRLLLFKKDVAKVLGIGIRTLDRMISVGEFSKPDNYLRGRPVWHKDTVEEWSKELCKKE